MLGCLITQIQAAEAAAKNSAQKTMAAVRISNFEIRILRGYKVLERESAKAAGKQLSERASSSALSHAIPVIGALVAGAVDCATTNSVGRFACKVFEYKMAGRSDGVKVFLPDLDANVFKQEDEQAPPEQ